MKKLNTVSDYLNKLIIVLIVVVGETTPLNQRENTCVLELLHWILP